jgi:transposase
MKESPMKQREEKRRRPRYSQEFRAAAVAMVRAGEQTEKDIAKALGCCDRQIRRWLIQADIDSGKRPGMSTVERQELAKLRREVAQLQEQNRLLREAQLFFSRGTR